MLVTNYVLITQTLFMFMSVIQPFTATPEENATIYSIKFMRFVSFCYYNLNRRKTH